MSEFEIADRKERVFCLDRLGASKYLSISTRLLDDLASAGHLPRVKIGRKTLFRVADLDAYIESRIEKVEVSE